MDKKNLRNMATSSISLMLIVILISIAISQYNKPIIYADGGTKKGDIAELDNNELDKNDTTKDILSLDNSIKQILGDKYLILKKSKNDQNLYSNINIDDIDIQELYIEKGLLISIKGVEKDRFHENSVSRVIQGIEYTGLSMMESEEPTLEVNIIEGNVNLEQSDLVKDKLSIEENDEIEETVEGENAELGESIVQDYDANHKKISTQNNTMDPVKGISLEYVKEENANRYTVNINITLDHIYVPMLYQDEENIYIDLKNPKDVYDKIIVVDAGHGGNDCGTVSRGELYYEKEINLDILLYLKDILDHEDIKVYYTRTTDQTVFLNPRVNLANDVEADLFLSIHCNSNESPSPYGSEVLYNELMPEDGFGSKQLAEISLEEITNLTKRVNRGIVSGSEMVIVGKANMPMALIEVAFMSNQEDLDFLLKEENKSNIADAIFNVITRAYDEMEP